MGGEGTVIIIRNLGASRGEFSASHPNILYGIVTNTEHVIWNIVEILILRNW